MLVLDDCFISRQHDHNKQLFSTPSNNELKVLFNYLDCYMQVNLLDRGMFFLVLIPVLVSILFVLFN